MALFRQSKDVVTQVLPLAAHPDKEKGLQSLIEANLEPIFGVRFVDSEFSTGQKHKGRIDTLGLDQDGSPVIIEYKLRSNDNVMTQGLFYLDWLMDHRGDFEVAARARLGDLEVSWAEPRLILLAGSFSRYDQYAVNRIDERIELWTYTLYDGGLLAVDLLSSEEVPSKVDKVHSVSKGGSLGESLKDGPPAKPLYDLNHHFDKMSPATRVLFQLLRDEIVGLGPEVTERFMNQYVGYRRLRNFTEVVGQKSKLNVYIDGPIENVHGVCEDVSGIGHWGTGHSRATVASEGDLLKVLPLIKQAYSLQE